MPSPTPNQVHIDALLTNLSIGYRPRGMIADQVFPVVPVEKKSDVYAVFPKDAWFRIPNTLRAPGTKPNRVTYTVGSGTYSCTGYGLGGEVWDETKANADRPVHDPERSTVELIRDNLGLDFEKRVSERCWTGCGSSATLTGTDAFSDFDNSSPIDVFRTGRQAIRSTTGLRPNVAIVPQKVMDVLMYHPDLIRATYPGAGVGGTVNQQQLAAQLQVDRVIVPDAIMNTAQEGQTAAFTDVWSTNIVMCYAEPSPGLMKPSFGYAFQWRSENGGYAPAFAISRKYDEEAGTTILWTKYWQDEKIVAPELGYLIKTGIN